MGELLQHPWLQQYATAEATSKPEEQGADLLSNLKAGFDAKKTCEWGRYEMKVAQSGD